MCGDGEYHESRKCCYPMVIDQSGTGTCRMCKRRTTSHLASLRVGGFGCFPG
jgi:hypothetical protein